MKLKIRSKFNHSFTDHGYLRSAVWKALYNFKVKRAQEARDNQFLFQNIKKMIFLRTLKCSKATVELTFTTLKSNACSPWNVCSVFDCKCPFLVNLVETENYQFKLKLVNVLVWISRIPWWCSLFLFLSGNTLFGQIWFKKLKLKFATNTNLNNAEFSGGFHFICFRLEIPVFGKFGQKNQNC